MNIFAVPSFPIRTPKEVRTLKMICKQTSMKLSRKSYIRRLFPSFGILEKKHEDVASINTTIHVMWQPM